MEKADRDEIREMLHDAIKGLHLQMEAGLDGIGIELKYIKDQTTRTNGRVSELEKTVNAHLPHTVVHCAQTKIIQELRDMMVSNRAIKSYLFAVVVVTGILTGVITNLFKYLF